MMSDPRYRFQYYQSNVTPLFQGDTGPPGPVGMAGEKGCKGDMVSGLGGVLVTKGRLAMMIYN